MKKTLVLLAVMFAAISLSAAPRTKSQMQDAARQAIGQQLSARHLAPRTDSVKVLRSTTEFDIIGYEEGGFAVIAADDLMPAVLGVSVARYSGGANANFQWWLEATQIALRHAVQQQQPLHVTVPDVDLYPAEVPSMVTSKWYQAEPYNGMCPIWSGSVRCLTGCVATAMAQVLNYHQTPEHGQGQRTIYYPQGNHTGQAVTANFEEDYYDWANMLDIYSYGNYNEEQANAVALLMRDCGVAADMQYGGPNEGSGAYSFDAAQGLRTYFGFSDAECLERDSYSEPDWMNIIYRELSENGPLYYGGASWSSGGHAFVFDGYEPDGKVSVNWGWSGDDDGYYLVSQLNPSGYNFNMQQDMIVGIKSNKHSLLRSTHITMTTAGELQNLIEQDTLSQGKIGTLTIEGPLNIADMQYLRALAGWDVDGQPTDGRLRVLDLSSATIEGNEVPDSIFKDCVGLFRVRLPESTKTIGNMAFNGCRNLSDLRITSKSVPQLKGSAVFKGLPFGSAKLYVRSGLKTKYVQAAQWSDFGENNIIQVGSSMKVRNVMRFYGEENPEFTYSTTGEKVEGEPVLKCEATQWSPAGRYPITISSGSVVNAEYVNFVDGYMIVRKVDGLQAHVMNAERYEGEPNPQFQFSYSGMLSGDTTVVWAVEPTFVTSANEYSLPGVYTVYAVDGEAKSYNVTFQPGRLTVLPAPIPNAVSGVSDGTPVNQTVYNVQGQRVAQPAKGLYIRDGKKVLLK